jgi:hypothetical protein
VRWAPSQKERKVGVYEWLKREIAEVGTPRYFVVDGPATGELRAAILNEAAGVPCSFKEFVLQFGNARLYRKKSSYLLGVKGVPEPQMDAKGRSLLQFGHYIDRQAFFAPDTFNGGSEAPVLESRQGGLVEVAPSFREWLERSAHSIRKKIGKREWDSIVAGPTPFSDRELDVVVARRRFQWEIKGISQGGNFMVEVTNSSTLMLPFFSIGVRNRTNTFFGKVYIPTEKLAPGETATYEIDCYKRQIPPDSAVLHDLPDPSPEDRDSFRELRKL